MSGNRTHIHELLYNICRYARAASSVSGDVCFIQREYSKVITLLQYMGNDNIGNIGFMSLPPRSRQWSSYSTVSRGGENNGGWLAGARREVMEKKIRKPVVVPSSVSVLPINIII